MARSNPVKVAVVRRAERLTPHMIRLVLGAPEFADNGFTDKYVKLLFPTAGLKYPEPLDMAVIREQVPPEYWPVSRTYTIRAWDPVTAEVTIDFVYHGDEGIAGPWAAAAKADDEVWFVGPGGAYKPDPAADWHLLVGDESALPAIGAAVEALPPGARARVIVEVEDASEEQKFSGSGEVELTWLHRAGAATAPGDQLVAAVEGLTFEPGDVQVFVHGEAGFVQRLRAPLKERGITRDRLSISGYWRQGKNEDGWQAEKAETAKAERERLEREAAKA
ncbi:siderophore-interacting protein [Kribbella sp. NBC_01245]|uniref:siderophore-interacting protein n=1 Tax=Kribbella sp. NBC_01245 TaxID=2903578 RepID=UPI002E2CE27C|nr:siderophore-interacting protein [Kribbella sp. NBC_01245]